MTLPNATTEELLQEIALELAFAATGGKQSIVTMLDALRQLKQACQGHKNTSLAEAIAELLASLVPLTAESADGLQHVDYFGALEAGYTAASIKDRKSTRLNSSHRL